MYVKTRKLTISAACLALAMIFILAESVLGISTLFLLTLAGFLIGIVIREVGVKFGGAYFIASILLSFLIAPNKLKLITFIGVEAYLLFRELLWDYLEKDHTRDIKKVKWVYFVGKFLFFNLMLVPVVLFLPELIMPNMKAEWKLGVIFLGIPVWYLVDRAYDHFQIEIWDRMKRKK